MIATDADSRKLFSSQFRDDLIIQDERYADVFTDYLNNDFQKERILNGIIAFRKLCELDCSEDYTDVADDLFNGMTDRRKYGHHYNLPPEERDKPYSLMVTYDRHSPYPKSWAGFFYDVIEAFIYHTKHELGYSEEIAVKSQVYNLIDELGPKATSEEIYERIKDEDFSKKCNSFYTKPGGYLVPYIFFILRDRFRTADDFESQKKLIEQIKQAFPEAFDTASSYVGGFFGYDKFYEDYYTSLNLPILKRSGVIQKTSSEEGEGPSDDASQMKPEVDAKEQADKGDGPLENEDSEKDLFGHVQTLNDKLEKAICACTTDGSNLRKNLIDGVKQHKNSKEEIKEIFYLFISPEIVKIEFEKYFKFDSRSFRKKTIKKIGEYLQNNKSL